MTENVFSESDFNKLDLKKCNNLSVKDFLNVINSETLGKKVSTAINLKKQGHFNQAMLYVTEANRDQIIAIREIQGILDKLQNRDKTEIIFEKYRQTIPLQIGLSNGNDVLELLNGIGNKFEGTLSIKTKELHQMEEELDIVHDEFLFFQERMRGKISSEELDQIKEKVSQQTRSVYLAKKQIAGTLVEFVTERYKTLVAEDRIMLIRNIYLIITSSIETKDSKFTNV